MCSADTTLFQGLVPGEEPDVLMDLPSFGQHLRRSSQCLGADPHLTSGVVSPVRFMTVFVFVPAAENHVFLSRRMENQV
jgi:hypothetical protein